MQFSPLSEVFVNVDNIFVKRHKEGPEIGGPIVVNQTPLKWKQSRSDLFQLVDTANVYKRPEAESEYQKSLQS